MTQHEPVQSRVVAVSTCGALARALLEADEIAITNHNLANEFLREFGQPANLEINDTLSLHLKRDAQFPTALLLTSVLGLIAAVGLCAYLLATHLSEVATAIAVIVAIFLCVVLLLGLRALKGNARVDFNVAWNIGAKTGETFHSRDMERLIEERFRVSWMWPSTMDQGNGSVVIDGTSEFVVDMMAAVSALCAALFLPVRVERQVEAA